MGIWILMTAGIKKTGLWLASYRSMFLKKSNDLDVFKNAKIPIYSSTFYNSHLVFFQQKPGFF